MFDLERAKREGAITQDGWPVRILGERDHRNHSIIGACRRPGANCEFVGVWMRDGQCGWTMQYHGGPQRHPIGMNLQNLPQKQTRFVTSDGRIYESEAAAICRVMAMRRDGIAAGYAPVTITLTN